MKKIFGIIFVLGSVNLWSQLNLDLKIVHLWKNSYFDLANTYTDFDDNDVQITRTQYYLSNFVIYHDGGQSMSLDSVFVLGSSNISTYPLKEVFGVTVIDSVEFDLGIDPNWNHLDPTLYDPSHPLAPQTPGMHWGWTSGYNFLVIEGSVDSDANGSLDAVFEFHAVGDNNYLRHVGPLEPNMLYNGNHATIEFQCNISDWLVGVDLTSALFNHGPLPLNQILIDNTLVNTVFAYSGKTASVGENDLNQNSVHFDYSMPYAPTIFYKFPKSQYVDLKVIDMKGNSVLQAKQLEKEGNFFINKELPSGIYFANFTTSEGHGLSKKFVVRN